MYILIECTRRNGLRFWDLFVWYRSIHTHFRIGSKTNGMSLQHRQIFDSWLLSVGTGPHGLFVLVFDVVPQFLQLPEKGDPRKPNCFDCYCYVSTKGYVLRCETYASVVVLEDRVGGQIERALEEEGRRKDRRRIGGGVFAHQIVDERHFYPRDSIRIARRRAGKTTNCKICVCGMDELGDEIKTYFWFDSSTRFIGRGIHRA